MLDSPTFQFIFSNIELLFKAVPVSFTALMPCVNPIGTAIILSSLTAGSDPKNRKQLARRVAINAAALLIGSLLLGSHLLEFFGVSIPIVILAVSALVYLCFQYSAFVMKSLGESGTAVLMRLISFLVTCIGIQISWEGLELLAKQVLS